MCYNQFKPALGRPAQPEFALYHIFQKKSNKIASSNCTIFFPEITLFLCNLHNSDCPQDRATWYSPHMRPLLFGSPGPGAYARRAGRKLAPQKFFYPLGDRRAALIFPYGRNIATNLACCQQKFFFSLLWKNWSNSRDRTSPVEQSLPHMKVCPFQILRGKLIYVLNFDIIILNPKGKNVEAARPH